MLAEAFMTNKYMYITTYHAYGIKGLFQAFTGEILSSNPILSVDKIMGSSAISKINVSFYIHYIYIGTDLVGSHGHGCSSSHGVRISRPVPKTAAGDGI